MVSLNLAQWASASGSFRAPGVACHLLNLVIFSPSILDSISSHHHVFSPQLSGWHLSLQPEVARPSFLLSLLELAPHASYGLRAECKPSFSLSLQTEPWSIFHPWRRWANPSVSRAGGSGANGTLSFPLPGTRRNQEGPCGF